MAKFICYTPTTSRRFITENGIRMNTATSHKFDLLQDLKGVCLDDSPEKYSTWEIPNGTLVNFEWAKEFFSPEGEQAAHQFLRAKRLSPTAL